MQGLNLVALDGKIYRIGGMSPRNNPGAPTDNHSTADNARFDPATGKWEALPSLPEPRSSHDVVAIGNKIIVTGGWAIRGNRTDWADTLAILNLSAQNPRVDHREATFRRRALMAAALTQDVRDRGFDEKSEIVRTYQSTTPPLTHGARAPNCLMARPIFPAATVHQAICTSAFPIYPIPVNKTSNSGNAGKSTSRLAHRIASDGNSILVIGERKTERISISSNPSRSAKLKDQMAQPARGTAVVSRFPSALLAFSAPSVNQAPPQNRTLTATEPPRILR